MNFFLKTTKNQRISRMLWICEKVKIFSCPPFGQYLEFWYIFFFFELLTSNTYLLTPYMQKNSKSYWFRGGGIYAPLGINELAQRPVYRGLKPPLWMNQTTSRIWIEQEAHFSAQRKLEALNNWMQQCMNASKNKSDLGLTSMGGKSSQKIFSEVVSDRKYLKNTRGLTEIL